MSAPITGDPGRCAYLVSQYPALSHVFIESEVAALRGLGWQVQTFSVRPTALPHHAEAEQTPSLQAGGVADVVRALAATRPRAAVAGLCAAVRWGRGRSLRQHLWQVFYLAEALLLHRHMRERDLRHVHVHFANNSADIARLACRLGEAVDGPGSWTWSLTVHGPTELDRAGEHDLARKVLSASFVTCITDYCRSQVMRHTDPDEWWRLHVVPMGVPMALAGSAPAGGEPDGDSVEEALRVLFVGRLVPEKGPHVLLDAVDDLARSWAATGPGRAVELVVVGDGPLRASLDQRAAHAHPAARVRLVGGLPHDQLLPWYPWAHVFCLPSFAEGLPVVLMEALAHRLPVVTTPVAGIPELVVDQRTGLLVAPGRADLLAAALESLADDPALRRRLGEEGHSAVRSRHDARASGILLARLLARTTTAGARCAGPGEDG